MKPLSPRATELVAALEAQRSLGERLLRAADHRLDILAQLDEAPEPGIVPHLLRLIVDGPPQVARAAAGVVGRVVANSRSAELLEMDDKWRRSVWYAAPGDRGWWGLTPVELSRFETLGAAGTAVIGMASFHPNGFVREAAVAHLDLLADGRELPFLLIRLNDWVPIVADRARAAVGRRIGAGYAHAFLAHLPILLRLGIATRRHHGGVLDQVYALLRSPEGRSARDEGLGSSDTETRRVVFRLAREAERGESAELLARALDDPDTLIRLQAVADARRRRDAAALAPLLPRIIADPFPHVRREGLAAAAEHLPDRVDAWLGAALLDRNVVVREVARFFLQRRAAMTDFVAFYRDRVRGDAPARELAAAVAGVGETGGPGDVDVILPYLSHERAAVRRAAVRAIGTLDFDRHVAQIAGMLRDDAPSVSHAARDILRPRATVVGASSLLEIFRVASHIHSRLDALSVAAGLGKWESLPVLIEGTTATSERVRLLAREYLAAWIARQNRQFVRPTPDQLTAIGRALDAYRLALGRAIADEIQAALRVWLR